MLQQDIAGHKLSDAVIERLPTLCTLTAGGRISYSEVVAFQNVIRGELRCSVAKKPIPIFVSQRWTW
jgi:hypothetical protein